MADADQGENRLHDEIENSNAETPYLINLLDSNEKINWRDVV